MRGDGGSDISPGLVARVAQGLRWAVAGKAPPWAPGRAAPHAGGAGPAGGDGGDWFGPLEPLAPLAPPAVAGRQFDYPSGYNLVTGPRAYEPVSFRQLRGLADGYDLLRLVIETRKDQVAGLRWTVRRRGADPAAPVDPRSAAVMDFLARPDREHDWDAWLRMLLEDMLVIDAATLYPRRTQGGALYALEPIDGATIRRVLDGRGRTPPPPSPAYQQVLKGLPAVDYAADELLYLPRNPRSDRVYGLSPVEQVVMTVNIALRRQLHQLQYYTEGTVPEALIGVPENWTPDQIGQFQAYWDALLEDNTGTRRRARFVPATISKSFVQTKEAALKDDYDEWLARIVCYAFAVSPQWAVRQMNRATAETAQEQALAEGTEPLRRWVKGMMDRVLAECFGAPDLVFAWAEAAATDSLAQAQVDQIHLQSGVKSVNEVRAGLGLAAVAGGEAPFILTKDGAVSLATVTGAAVAGATATGADVTAATRAGGGGAMPGLAKDYNPGQPRISAGSPAGGQWTSAGGGNDGSSIATPSSATVVAATAEALPYLGEAEAVGAISGGALAALPILLAPSHLGGGAAGTLPGHPDIHYHFDETRLTLTRADADGGEKVLYDGQCGLDSVFRTPGGTVLATLAGGGVAIDPAGLAGLVQPRDVGAAAGAAQPSKEECDQEWAEAWKYCNKLDRQGKLSTDGHRGFGQTAEQCARGMVSEACGGNPVN